MASDYTLSVHGEFKDDISKELGGVSSVVAGFKDNFKSAASGALSFGDVLKANLLSDAIMSGLTKLKDGLISAGKAAYAEGAALEQSLGGVETLFKENADTVKKYADEAYKTAGLSANEYMESVTGFSASLLQSLGGDTEKAAEAANQAIIDMSDNANKMGTSMDSIQSAYAGFAKQNFTMLDNLKLGYGGTKEEMQRLLEDAEKISGVHYDISNLNDIYSAIHVIQTELDITGTTAKEASQTLAGSFAAMGSAWKNVLGKITIGDDISDELGELKDSVLTFADNLLPAVGNMIDNLPAVFEGAVSLVGDLIPKIGEAIGEHADALLEAGHTLLQGIISGIIEYGPGMVEGALALVSELRGAIIENLPGLLEAGGTILTNIISGITESLPQMLETGGTILSTIVSGISGSVGTLWETGANIISNIKDTITNNLPNLLQSGVEILSNIARGIIDHIPDIITVAGNVLNGFIDFVYDNAPDLLQAGADLLLNLVQGIVDNLPEIASAAIHTIADFAKTIGEHLPEILEKGIEIIGQLIAGLIKAIPDIVAAIPQIIQSIVDEFLGFDWLGLGKDIIDGIGKGIVDFAGNIADAVSEAGSKALRGIKDFFGIASPSKLMAQEVGRYIPEGIAVGITANTASLEKSISRMDDMILSDVGDMTGNTSAAGYRSTTNSNTYNYGGFNLSVYGAEGQDEEALADIIEARIRARIAQEEAVFA